MKTENEIKKDMEALADMLSDIRARVKAYNMLAASAAQSMRVGLLEGDDGSSIDACDTFFPNTNFWYPSSWGC